MIGLCCIKRDIVNKRTRSLLIQTNIMPMLTMHWLFISQ
jgi:hypothetical protein